MTILSSTTPDRAPRFATGAAIRPVQQALTGRSGEPNQFARIALRALHEELSLYPKPGLVSPRDTGSHDDMNAATMWRTIVALRHGFRRLECAGTVEPSFAELNAIGREMEAEMGRVTRGVNTHRGAIFHLGLLVATAAGGVAAEPRGPREEPSEPARALLASVQRRWGAAIQGAAGDHDPRVSAALLTHGEQARRLHGAGGARQEAAAGYPTVCRTALPVFHDTLRRLDGCGDSGRRRTLVQTLFALIATVEDTNLLHRAGPGGLTHARAAAQRFLDNGGVFQPDWEARAETVHRDFCRLRLSPGGSADLLAVTIFAAGFASA